MVTDGEKSDGIATDNKFITMDQLREDMIYEIFSWLPAKSIFKFKSCSKSIDEFTKEKNFAAKQTQNMTLQDDSSFFIQAMFRSNNIKTEIHALSENEASSSSSGIPPNFLQFLNKKKVRILFSSNGLLLCKITRQRKPEEVELFVCNPTTQTYSSIATPPGLLENPRRLAFAFGCNHNNKAVDDDNEEYQLILLEYNEDQEGSEYFVCKACMTKEGVWKEREKSSFMGQKLYYHGVPFKNYLLSYNFESGETRRVLYPKEVIENGFDGRKFLKWDKVRGSNNIEDDICLVVLDMDYLVFTFWVLTDYKSSSWSRFFTLNLEEMGLNRFSLIYEFAILNGNSFLFATPRYVYRTDLIGGGEKKLERICEHNGEHSLILEFISYSNTLCSCGADVKNLSSFMSRKRRRN